MDVIIVCHTEFGFVRNKKVIYEKKATQGVTKGVLNLMGVAKRYKAKVTFAVMPEVAEYFPKDTGQEIGLHVHAGWETFGQGKDAYEVGDAYLRVHSKQSSASTVLRDYSYDEQFDMICRGKKYLAEILGSAPTTFVAGRWSLNNDTVKALVANGFTHDCSAQPGAKPAHHDWSRLPRICMPYHPHEHDYQKKGAAPLLMVPGAQYFPGGGVNPEMVPWVGLAWLKACFSEYYRQGAPLFHICLHSPCMTDDYFISAMDRLLEFIAGHEQVHFKCAREIQEYPNRHVAATMLPYLAGLNLAIIKSYFLSSFKIFL